MDAEQSNEYRATLRATVAKDTPWTEQELARLTTETKLFIPGYSFMFVIEPEVEMLTPFEARALRLASIFGTPDPTPPEIESALRKIKAIEATDA